MTLTTDYYPPSWVPFHWRLTVIQLKAEPGYAARAWCLPSCSTSTLLFNNKQKTGSRSDCCSLFPRRAASVCLLWWWLRLPDTHHTQHEHVTVMSRKKLTLLQFSSPHSEHNTNVRWFKFHSQFLGFYRFVLVELDYCTESVDITDMCCSSSRFGSCIFLRDIFLATRRVDFHPSRDFHNKRPMVT